MPSFHPIVRPQPVTIGPVQLTLAPAQITESITRNVTIIPTLTGSVRTAFGMNVKEWTVAGTVGDAGLPKLHALQRLEGQPGKPERPVPFRYPYKYGRTTFQVFVDECTYEERNGDDAFRFYFTLKLRQHLPRTKSPVQPYLGQF